VTDYLYVTADVVGAETGGGIVTRNESDALRALGGEATTVLSYPNEPRPWGADDAACRWLLERDLPPKLAHFYSGTFTNAIGILKRRGCKVTYTAAAHDINVSREEHEKLGLPFDYPHLTDPEQWERYVRGYQLADVVICPSTLSKRIMESYGCKNVVVIPHGVDLPSTVKSRPKRFAAAYLGQAGPDKGLRYLLEAWAKLDYKDALLTIAGYGTENLLPLVRQFDSGNVYLRGRVDNVDEVYDACSVLIQPSASEGFGCEVLEALARGRPVICSDGAGAADVISDRRFIVPARNARILAEMIHRVRLGELFMSPEDARAIAMEYPWSRIREWYQYQWRTL